MPRAADCRYNGVPMADKKTGDKYAQAMAKAKTAVAQINDERQKKIAYQAILDDSLMETFAQRYVKDPANWICVLISLGLAIFGSLSLWCKWPIAVSIVLAGAINLVIVILIVLVGLRADGVKNTENLLPHRLPALLMGFLLFVGLLHCFGNIYAKSGGICPGGSKCQEADKMKP